MSSFITGSRLFYAFHWPLTSYHVSTRYSSWVYTSWDGKTPSSNQVAVVTDGLGWDPLFASEFDVIPGSVTGWAPQFFTSHGFHTKKNKTIQTSQFHSRKVKILKMAYINFHYQVPKVTFKGVPKATFTSRCIQVFCCSCINVCIWKMLWNSVQANLLPPLFLEPLPFNVLRGARLTFSIA